MTKICSKCKILKPELDFPLLTKNSDKTRAECRSCSNEKAKEYRKLNPERTKINNANRLKNNPEKYRRLGREYYKKNAKKIRERKYELNVFNKYINLKSSAKKRNINLDISKYEYDTFVKDKKCFYCESDLPKYGAGLDRIDSTKGYSLNNVVCCCHKCNIMKLKMTTLEFSKHILKLISFANNYVKNYKL